MFNLAKLSTNLMEYGLAKARSGKTGFFSLMMWEVIPFNKPHRVKVIEISDRGCAVTIPARRRNLNHLGTMHACAMATAGEYVSGLNVIEAFDISKFRLIMSRLEVDYVRRPKGGCEAKSVWPEGVKERVEKDMEQEGVGIFTLESKVMDSMGELVATTTTHWQVKSWEKVRAK